MVCEESLRRGAHSRIMGLVSLAGCPTQLTEYPTPFPCWPSPGRRGVGHPVVKAKHNATVDENISCVVCLLHLLTGGSTTDAAAADVGEPPSAAPVPQSTSWRQIFSAVSCLVGRLIITRDLHDHSSARSYPASLKASRNWLERDGV